MGSAMGQLVFPRGENFVRRLMIALMMVLGLASAADAKKKAKARPVVAPVSVPTPAATPDNVLVLKISTGGFVRIQLRPDKAPAHVARIKLLARAGFYNGVIFHRVIEGFMAQTGDPDGNGQGGSPLPDLKAEFNDLPHFRGTVSAARTDKPDTANSQFFLVFAPTLRLDGKYTVFGRILSGMNFVDLIERGEPPATPSRVEKAWIEGDGQNAALIPLVVPATPVPVATPTPAPVPATTP
jgi:cyclophilin family peptidyl-prolyl cis-trans isomerase